MKRKLIIGLLILSLIAVPLFAAACEEEVTPPAEEEEEGPPPGEEEEEAPPPPEVIELTCANWFGAPAPHSVMLQQFCDDVEEQTGGQITIDFYPGGTLLDRGAVHQGVVDGVADIGYDAIHYTPGRFLVSEVLTSTLGWPSAWVGAHVAMDFYNKYEAAQADWDEVKVLFIHANEPKVIYTKEPVRTLEDLEGLLIRSPGSPGDIINALGGTSAPGSTATLADDISKGTLDGAFLPLETIKTFKTAEVINYITMCWNIGSTDLFYLVMNKDAYESLEALPEAKAVFDRLVGQYFESFAGLMWNSIDFGGLAYAEDLGVEVIELSAAEAARWEAAAAPAVEVYVQRMIDEGYSEAEVREWIDFIQERIEYWTEKQIAWKILSLTGPEEMQP